MLPVASSYPLLDVVWTMLVFFGLVIWIGLLFKVFGDLFRRHDISGWAKAGWCLVAIVLPYIGVLIYVGTQGSGMAERSLAQSKAAQAQFDEYVRTTAGGGGTAEEIAKAKELLDSGAISQQEFDSLKQKALA